MPQAEKIKKRARHGQKTDRYGNRLDARGIKQGGTFSNATTPTGIDIFLFP